MYTITEAVSQFTTIDAFRKVRHNMIIRDSNHDLGVCKEHYQ